MSNPDILRDDENGGPEPPSDELLAAELVLGVLDVEQRRRAQARVTSDFAFAQLVSAWEQRLGPLLGEVAPVEPPARLWPSIQARLGWRESAPAGGGLWSSLAFWRTAAGVAAAIALAAIIVGGNLRRAPPPAPVQPPTTAEVNARAVTPLSANGTVRWLASVDTTHGTVLMVPVPAAPDAQGRVPELWLIPAGQAPRPLGLLSLVKSHTLPVPPDLRSALVAGSTLAVSLEPPGGAPAGVPTGPIIATGAIRT